MMRAEALKIDREALLAAALRGAFPDERGRYGPFGGRYVPETLVPALDRLEEGVRAHLRESGFRAELENELRTWVGRPTPLTLARELSRRWGAEVWLKREDLAHTGAHKINNAIGQALLAKRLGAKRIVAETGAGQHGVASAAACARLGMPCVVYMGAIDMERQAPNVGRMKLLGAEVVPVTSGDQTLRAAIDEALRDWVADPNGTYYLLGSAVGPHPYPYLVREFQSVIGVEARAQMLEQAGALPDVAVACVGGGSNAIGASGYVACAQELQGQLFEKVLCIDRLCVASGSAGTHAGLVVGFIGCNMNIPIVGIGVSRDPGDQEPLVYDLALKTAERLGVNQDIPRQAVLTFGDYWRPKYSVPNRKMVEAVNLMARTEGILLDPVYTGKAMAGLIDLGRKGYFKKGENVLFVHTGGAPGLYAYTQPLLGLEKVED